MHAARFSVVGGLAGVVMSMTTGWLITGYLCHRFQKATPMTWRDEVWLQHALAVLLSGIGGATLGALDADRPRRFLASPYIPCLKCTFHGAAQNEIRVIPEA